jgi:hypothetical protein
MGVLVYCILPGGTLPPSGLTGIHGAGISALPAGPLSCWTSTLSAAPDVSAENVAAHNTVVQAAMDGAATPVPLRFGQWFAADAEAAARIAEEASRWSDVLRRIDGCSEFGVHIASTTRTARDVQTKLATTGTDYMAALARRQAEAAERRRQGEALCAWLLDRAGPLVRESRTERAVGADELAVMAHLIRRHDAEAYQTMIRDVRGERPDVRILVSGPWPPYSFVT